MSREYHARSIWSGILAAWCFYLAWCVLCLLFMVGCHSPAEPDRVPTTEAEAWAVTETARLSALAGQEVRGIIIDECFVGNCETHGAAWYEGQFGRGARGRAYFVSAWVNSHTSADISWDAAHEVCHSVTGFAHDERHAWCNYVVFYGQSPWTEWAGGGAR